MKRYILWAIVALLLVCLCAIVAGLGGLVWYAQSARAPLELAATSVPAPATLATSPASTATADALQRAQIPRRDLYQIVPRLRKNLALLTPAPTPTPRARNIGERESFFVIKYAATGEYRTVNATLHNVTPHAYFWVEDGLSFDASALKKSADFFEQRIYPTNVKYFGAPGAGLDGDTRVHILNTHFEEAAGYVSSVDAHPRALAEYSNERNLIYMNIKALAPSSDEYNGTLAHEFVHLISQHVATNKTGWIEEGMADLAVKLNGFPLMGLAFFARQPNTQLNTWSNTPNDSIAHYAASYLFLNYVAHRFGAEMIRDILHTSRHSIPGIQQVLDQRAGGLPFDDLFADWAITNILNDPHIENGRYAYTNEPKFRVTGFETLRQYPVTKNISLKQYAASYFTLVPDVGDVTIYFTGTTTTKLLAADAHSGKWMWYSNRADMANTTLTRAFDLTRATRATLQFWTWYDIEKDYDYAYVAVSTDGGKTWDTLPGNSTTTENPNGANYGHAFTGRSGTKEKTAPAQWIEEQMDLSPYAGKKILVRFEYITDDAYNAPGWAIDDITIPEIGYHDDIENGEGGWQAAGFVRVDNVLPQKFIVQLIESGNATRIVRIPLDAQNRGSYTINGFGKNVTRATLVVTAHAPTTTEPTAFQFTVVSSLVR
jgi:hypothetical protein